VQSADSDLIHNFKKYLWGRLFEGWIFRTFLELKAKGLDDDDFNITKDKG
jgi:hypothetical protein